MELLRDIGGSVLWLSTTTQPEQSAERAEARGVNRERLVFARRVTLNQDHLARLRLADLFLDTLPLGAHSTACDALWRAAGAHVHRRHVCWSGSDQPSFGLGVASSSPTACQRIRNAHCVLPVIRRRSKPLRQSLPLIALAFRYLILNALRDTLRPLYTAISERHRRGELPAPLMVPPLSPEHE